MTRPNFPPPPAPREEPVEGGHQRAWDFGFIPGAPAQEQAEDLAKWWVQVSEDEIMRTVPKSIEYGSADLKLMGDAMLLLLPQMAEGLTVEERSQVGQELGIAFYVLGKVARLFGAYEQGRLPSDDTWFDLGIYPKMVRRIREVGEWK